ncbi:MAG: hypothetical protein U5K54_01640 [Cytophagales bacterium]|nr:hypothetical protein [Cytophagales bacterium]
MNRDVIVFTQKLEIGIVTNDSKGTTDQTDGRGNPGRGKDFHEKVVYTFGGENINWLFSS